MNPKYIRIEALIDSLKDACEKESVHPDDLVIEAEILDDGHSLGPDSLPAGTMKLVIRSQDPEAMNDTEMHIFIRENEEETEA